MMKRVGERGVRKERADKKKQLRPWLPGTLRAEINSLTKSLDSPSRAAIMEKLLFMTVTNRGFIDYIKPYMARTVSLPVSSDGAYHFTVFANPNRKNTADDLYSSLKAGVSNRASFFVTKEVAETYLHPLTSGLDISYDGLTTLIIDYGMRELVDKLAPGYTYKYIYTSKKNANKQAKRLS
ncbi:hypothetical protein P9G84_02450 [Brevibacillus centrosporus]|uniref:hypothetical protein n=1 Tax=Brevibacillus centrosporus TaxID=54910 RepID=UPI001143DDC9|nr:hypothetical protein [Brevibacillus centrosporus]MEC2127854.1 hypothetical protein [Brevibacillus centrosporus]GED32094.1 hypothetical protein BCE02nite_32350 [Brevibacillus centrosporus]